MWEKIQSFFFVDDYFGVGIFVGEDAMWSFKCNYLFVGSCSTFLVPHGMIHTGVELVQV